jgi:predicted dehydrogenase
MFVEKPRAADLNQAHHLANLCRQYNATVMLGFLVCHIAVS